MTQTTTPWTINHINVQHIAALLGCRADEGLVLLLNDLRERGVIEEWHGCGDMLRIVCEYHLRRLEGFAN